MSKVLIIGCGGVANVAIRKCCQCSDVFTEICIASRTKSFWALVGAMILGVLACYAFGTLWYVHLIDITFAVGLAQCVVPFLPFDAIKIALAALLVQRLRHTNLIKL